MEIHRVMELISPMSHLCADRSGGENLFVHYWYLAEQPLGIPGIKRAGE